MNHLATLRSFTFNDFDAFASSIEDADMSMKLPRLDRSLWSMHQVSFSDALNLQVAYEGSGSIPAGAVRGEGFVLFLAEGDCRGNGDRVDRDSIFLMPPGKEFCNPTKGENEWMGVFIPYATADVIGLDTSPGVIGSSARVIRPPRGATERLRRNIKRYVGNAQVEPGLLQEAPSVALFRDALASSIKDCLSIDAAKPKGRTGRPRIIDARMIASAIELIEDSPESTSTVPELVQALGVSERAVQTGFQKYLGTSPQRYLELSRLHRARKQLLTSPLEEATVTNVAAQVGMWDFGRFAQRYAKVFGEKPSETLKRREGRKVTSRGGAPNASS